MTRFDVAVVGLGAHGTAIAAHCARAGLSVCGLDRATPPHAGASHHGESRIVRKAYYEHPSYVPLLARAYALWDALAGETGIDVMRRTGGLMIGPRDGELVPGALASAREHGLAHEWLDARALAARFPAFTLAPTHEAIHEPDAGVLFPEAAVRAHGAVARDAGATLLVQRQVERIETRDDEVVLACRGPDGSRETVRATRCVVAAGAGLAALGLPLSRAVRIERQVVAHFAPRRGADAHALAALPIFAVEEDDGRFHYGFPDLGTGVKVARHHGGATSTRDDIDAAVRDADVDALRAFLASRLPGANGALGTTAVCRYTNTADGHFAIDARDPRVLVVSACSGHGFKFAPVIGEIVASLVREQPVPFDLALFDAARLDTPATDSGAPAVATTSQGLGTPHA